MKAWLRDFIPTLCNIFGVLFLVIVIGITVPLSVPRLFGYDVYRVISPSMEPEIPLGSVVYVKAADPLDIKTDDVIVYRSMDDTVTHRVVENRPVEGEFITKGDVNAAVDAPVSYDQLVGRVTYHIPIYGELTGIYDSVLGKIYLFGFAVVGVMLNMLASRLRERNQDDEEPEGSAQNS